MIISNGMMRNLPDVDKTELKVKDEENIQALHKYFHKRKPVMLNKDFAEVRQMDEREKLLFDFLDSVYGNVEYADGFIYFEDEDTGNRYKVAVYTTNWRLGDE